MPFQPVKVCLLNTGQNARDQILCVVTPGLYTNISIAVHLVEFLPF